MISDISVEYVFLYRLGKHSVGGTIVVNLWGGGCMTLDKDLRGCSPTLVVGRGGAGGTRFGIQCCLYGTRLHSATWTSSLEHSVFRCYVYSRS